MTEVHAGKRRVYFLELTEGTGSNSGGFECDVYRDNSHDFPLDGGMFTIPHTMIRKSATSSEKKSIAISYAIDYVKKNY